MPMVGDKKFAYTAKGKKEAKEYGKKTGMKPVSKPMKKMAGRGR
jgi:hypothetical protein